MENRTIKTKDLRLARIKYFDLEHNGAELCDMEVYAFLQAVGDKYVNVFKPEEELPVYDRAPYANVTKTGEDYGNRLIHVSGEVMDGPCYVMELVSVPELVGMDIIGLDALKEYVLSSKKLFADRISLIGQETGTRKASLFLKLREDMEKMAAFKDYLDGHKVAGQGVK